MKARATLLATVKDLRRALKDPWSLLLAFAIPIAIGTVIILSAGGREGPKPRAEVLVVDEDDSFASGLVVTAMERAGGIVRPRPMPRDEAAPLLEAGEASALLVIPAGFEAELLAGEEARLELVTNPAQRILPQIAEETLELLGDAAFHLRRLLGPEIRELHAAMTGDEEPGVGFSALLAARIERKFREVGDVFFPPRLALETRIATCEDDEDERRPPTGVLFLPGVVIMGLLFGAQVRAEDVWTEMESRTLDRIAAAPLGALPALLGKWAAAALALGLLSGAVLLAGMLYLELPLWRFPLACVWTLFCAFGLVPLLFLVTTLARTRRAANVLASALLFPLLMLGGSFFPSEFLPDILAFGPEVLPNGLAIEGLKSLLLDRIDGALLARAALVLVGVGGLCNALALRRLRRRLGGEVR